MKDSVLGFLVGAYLIISQICALIFYFDLIKEYDNFFAMIFIAPIVAEFKAIFWIFTIW